MALFPFVLLLSVFVGCMSEYLTDVGQCGNPFDKLADRLSLIEAKLANQSQTIDAQAATINFMRDRCCRKDCPVGFDYVPIGDGGGCYKAILKPLTWYQATDACRKIVPGTHLVAIQTEAEQRALQSYVQQAFKNPDSSICATNFYSASNKGVWSSGQTKDPNVCGTPFQWKVLEGVDIPFSYAYWFTGEPNCVGNRETCVFGVQISDGTANLGWNDASCTITTCALCEY